jgi:hypothetical protein
LAAAAGGGQRGAIEVAVSKRTWRAVMLAGLACGAVGAAAAEDVRVQTLPSSAMVGVERLRLPGGEPMGLVGTSYVFELQPGWWVGPAFYGAATGHRGGLITWGVEAQHRWRLGEDWGVVTGLYAGGGGGAAAPVGGGLMLRPHADLMVNLGGWQAGLTASQVRFPSGAIRSSQFGLLVMIDDRFAYAPPGHDGERVDFSGRGGIGADRMQVVLGRYRHAGADGGSLGFVGLRLEQSAGPVLSGTLEAAGAAQGGADGYMEALAGLAWRWPVFGPAFSVGVRGAVGLAGGGAVQTGGGTLGKAALISRLQLGPRFTLDLEAGRAKAFTGSLNANYAQASLGMALSDTATGADWTSGQHLHDMSWSAGVLRYQNAQRKDGSTRPMELVALKFNRALTEHVYLSGEAQSAIAGGAGAYSVGLVGLGLKTALGQGSPWSVGAEALVGAAGGGGVASNGGAVAQPMAWIGRDLGTYSRLKLGVGKIRSRHGGLSTPVVEATYSFDFGTP